jgi:DNA-binding MarR family transcriptional regulator
MSTPPLPKGLRATPTLRVANRLHSIAIHLLRRARVADLASGLTPERSSLLSVLSYVGPRTVSELAVIEQVSRPAVSRTLKALVDAGLARMERVAEDRRQVLVHATPRGQALMEAGRKRRLQRIAESLAPLAEAELALLARAATLLERLEQPTTGP